MMTIQWYSSFHIKRSLWRRPMLTQNKLLSFMTPYFLAFLQSQGFRAPRMFWSPRQLQESNVPKPLCRIRPSLLSLTRWKHLIIVYHYRHWAVSLFHALIDLTAFCKQAIIGGSSEMMACGESDWQYAPQPRRRQRWASGLKPRMDVNIKPPMKLIIKSKYQWDHLTRDYSNDSSSLLLLHLRADGSSCYFSFFCSHSLILLTSRLRINYISIDWPLEGGIDIYGPPSAPRPMCIPQHRAPASCITPGLYFWLYSLGSQAWFSARPLPASSHPLYAQDAQRCALNISCAKMKNDSAELRII